MSAPQPRPITILIAALGGEGGGVLTDWIVSAAAQLDFPVQSTSIPGVAQRTGATTYYIEIVPVPARELPARPVLALAPGVSDVDIVLASELMEAGRTIAGGFVTPDRTLVIASTARSYLVVEKMAMGDGRYDSARLIKAVETHAQSHLLLDMDALAKQSGAMINAVMLGLIAGCGRVPIPAAAFERAIRADRKAVDANLRGFRGGLDATTNANARPAVSGIANEDRATADADALVALERAIVMPAAARDVVLAGARRLAAYQDLAYAQLYLDRLAPIRAADARVGAGGRLVRETARHLAVRMSYEDVIRVAQAKIDPARLPRIAAAMGVSPGEPFTVTSSSSPASRNCARCFPLGSPSASSPRPSGAACSRACIGGWRSTARRCRAFCASGCWPSCAAGGRNRTASSKSSTRSKRGCASSPRRRGFRAISRSKSRNVRGLSRAMAIP